jgi:ADP-heptose:LPS heptosyltransferase
MRRTMVGARVMGRRPNRRYPRRWPLFRIVDAVVGLIPAPRRVRGVLVLRGFGIGDAIIYREVIPAIAQAMGVTVEEVTLLGNESWRPAAAMLYPRLRLDWLDERRFERDPIYRLRLAARLRRRGYAAVVCSVRFRRPQISDSLITMIGAPARIVIMPEITDKTAGMFAHYLPRMTQIVPALADDAGTASQSGTVQVCRRRHEIEQQRHFVSVLAGRPMPLSLPRLRRPEGPNPLTGMLVPAAADGRLPPYVVLHVGASLELKRWPVESWARLAHRAAAAGYHAALIGGPSERHLVRDVAAAAAALDAGRASPLVLALVDTLDFEALARLLADSAAVVANDTGPGHLAIALGAPSVLVVGGGHYGAFMPYPPGLVPAHARFVSHPMPCFQCAWHCTVKRPEETTAPCIAQIGVERVWEALDELLLKR